MKANDLRQKNAQELNKELMEALREQFNLRMQRGAGQSVRPSDFSRVRKHIARVKTVLNEKMRSGEAS